MAQVTFRASATGTGSKSGSGTFNVVINKPTGTIDGDYMLAHIQTSGNISVSSAPSGWTLVDSDTTASGDSYLYSKTASSEGSSYTWTLSTGGNASASGGISTFYNQHSTPIAASSKTIGDVDTTAEGTAITPTTSPDSLLVVFIGTADTVHTFSSYAIVNNNPTWTEAYENSINFGVNDSSQAMAYAEWDYASTTGDFSATISGSAESTVYFLSLRPAALSFTTTIGGVSTGGNSPTYSVSQTYVDTIGGVTLDATAPSIVQKDNIWTTTNKPSTTWTTTSK